MTPASRRSHPAPIAVRARILLAPTGTLGDIYPFIAVALALRTIGCDPVIATMDQYAPEVEAAGIDFRPVRPSRADLEADGLNDAIIAHAVARDLRAGIAFSAPHVEATLADLTAAAAECDVMVGGSLSAVARLVAEAAGLPVATLVLQPMGFLSCTDPPAMGEAPWLTAIGRSGGAAAVAALYRVATLRGRASLRLITRLRAKLGLPRVADELRDGPRRGDRLVALYPAAFAPLPRDAPAHAVSAGFAFYNGQPAPLTTALTAFLDAGPPPLVFTLGSFVTHAAGDFYTAAAVITRHFGRRAVLLVGRHAVVRHAPLAGTDVFVMAAASHALLFPRAAAVVHHGGIGTIAQALRAGLPQLACPYFGDQFDNAAHLKRLGVGAVVPMRNFDAQRGVTALASLLTSPLVAHRARALAKRSTNDDGPAIAAAAIAALAGTTARAKRRG